MNKKELNVVYSSDDNYAQHMGVSIYSLLKKNNWCECVNIYIIDNEISKRNRERLRLLISEYPNTTLHFIPFYEWRNKLRLDMSWNISVSSYGRLFLADMLPDTMERILYLDCDMIVCSSLEWLWGIRLNTNVLAAVQDSVNTQTKQAVGLDEKEMYFNAGMLLINLNTWRKKQIENKCLSFIDQHKGRVLHHDQGVLNGVLKGKFYKLPVEYNLMTIHYMVSRKKLLNYFQDKATFYSDKEIREAKVHPVILHYTPSFTTRPWVRGCKHPYRGLYWEYLKETPWSETRLIKDTRKWYMKLIDWMYRIF